MSATDDISYQSLGPLKRLKASRACDQCRKLRTRCDEAPINANTQGTLELSTVLERKCKRCLRLNQDCTFILPIGETRDRPKKVDSPGSVDGKELGSPTGSDASRPALLRKQSSMVTTANTLEPLEKFKQFLDHNFPIIASKDISHNTSVLLTCCVRLVVASFTDPANTTLHHQIQTSIRSYFVQKQAITTPTLHNVQSLMFLSLFVNEAGAGNKFISAIRMACALNWNHPGVPNTDRNPVVGLIWWTLVSQDIWLYLYTGLPPFLDYTAFNVPKPSAPSFYTRLITLTEVLRFYVRPASVGEYLNYLNPIQALKEWEQQNLQDIYVSLTSVPSYNGNAFDTQTFLQVLHAVVLAIFVLQDSYFVASYSQYKSASIHNISTPGSATPTSQMSMGYPSPQDPSYNTPSSNIMPSSSDVVTYLLQPIRVHLQHKDLFNKFTYLYRFAEICVLALIRIERQEQQQQNYNSGYMIHHDPQVDERNRILLGWRDLVGEDEWANITKISERVSDGWNIIFNLNDEMLDDEVDLPDSISSFTGEGSEHGTSDY